MGSIRSTPSSPRRAGVSGTFGSVSDSFAFLRPELSYDANNVFLTLTQDSLVFRRRADPEPDCDGSGCRWPQRGGTRCSTPWSRSPRGRAGGAGQSFGRRLCHAGGRAAARQRMVRDAVFDRLQQAANAPSGAGAPLAYQHSAAGEAAAPTDLWGQVYGSLGSLAGERECGRRQQLGRRHRARRGWPAWRVARRGGCRRGLSASASMAGPAALRARITASVSTPVRQSSDTAGFRRRLTRHDVQSTRSIALPGLTETLRGTYGASTAQGVCADLPHARSGDSRGDAPCALRHGDASCATGLPRRGGGAALSSMASVLTGTFAVLGVDAGSSSRSARRPW